MILRAKNTNILKRKGKSIRVRSYLMELLEKTGSNIVDALGWRFLQNRKSTASEKARNYSSRAENTPVNNHPMECIYPVFRSDTEWLVQNYSSRKDDKNNFLSMR